MSYVYDEFFELSKLIPSGRKVRPFVMTQSEARMFIEDADSDLTLPEVGEIVECFGLQVLVVEDEHRDSIGFRCP